MIRLADITIKQGDFKLSGIELELFSGQYGVLMGRSG